MSRMKDYDEKFSSMGDLAEFYNYISNKEGRTKANIWYLFQIFSSVIPYLIFSVFWRLIMLKTYLKTALRNIKKNKGFSVINIAGLALGMACFILIFLYVQNELSYDNFHESADRIYRVQRGMGSNYMGANASVITYGPLASALVSTYPEVINAVRIEHRDAYDLAIKYKNAHFYERGFYVDRDFFDIFSYDFTRGDAKTALVDPFSIVITEELARKYFGNEEPFGKTLTIVEDRSYDAKITGIIKKVPGNSHLQFDFVLSMTSLNTIYEAESFGQSW
jgi:putative ABC transport system permease protein